MRKSLYLTSLVVLFLISSMAYGQGPTPAKNGPQDDKLNGYDKSEYYHLTIKVPADVLSSTKAADKINVYMHQQITAWEQTNKRPVSSQEKAQLEDYLQKIYDDGVALYMPPPTKSAPAQADPPREKPAIIED